MSTTLHEFLAGLSPEKRTELTTTLAPLTLELKTLTAKGTKANVAAGKLAFDIVNVLSKSGAGGQTTNYCRENDLSRTTLYRNRQIYRWEVLVPQPFKDMAKRLGKDLDEVAQNRIIRIALADVPGTVEAAEVEVKKVTPQSSDPVGDAVEKAAKTLAAAFEGDLETLSALTNLPLPKYEGAAEDGLEAMQKRIACAMANTVQGVRVGLAAAAKKHKSLEPFIPALDRACMGDVPQLAAGNLPTAA